MGKNMTISKSTLDFFWRKSPDKKATLVQG